MTMKLGKAWTLALAAGAVIGANQADAAVVSVSSSFSVNAQTAGYGYDAGGIYHNHSDSVSFNQGTQASYSQLLSQNSTVAPILAPGTAHGEINATGTQTLASTGLLTLSGILGTNATASCTPSPCSAYQGTGTGQLSFTFTLTTPYQYTFDFDLTRDSGSNNGALQAYGYLYNNTTSTNIWSGSSNVQVAGPATSSLLQTGLLGPGTYNGYVYLYGYATSGNTTPALMYGGGDLQFSLTAPVPLPAAAWLMLSGLGGVAAFARRRRRAAA